MLAVLGVQKICGIEVFVTILVMEVELILEACSVGSIARF
jgi:hypothetical protein